VLVKLEGHQHVALEAPDLVGVTCRSALTS